MNRFFNSYKTRIALALLIGLVIYMLLAFIESVLRLQSALIANHLLTSASVGAVLFFVFEEVIVAFRSRQSKILNMIVDALQRISAGDLSVRLPETGAVELRQISKLTNQIVGNLKDDIAKLEKLERVRSEFLANVSHELRTPIFSIQGFIETLIDGAMDDPGVNKEFLQKAYEHSERLNTLLNDLIEISRIESGEMRMSFRYFNISEFLKNVTEEMRPKADKKSLQILVEADVPEMLVLGDRERLRQVLSNLIDNSIKYTQEGGRIEVGFSEIQNVVRVYVRDNGTGIGKEHLGRIFERFYRVDKDRSRSVGGTGLGLAIVKHIIEAHNSKVEVKSELGKGSEFSFLLKK
ncbi:MAG TPA: ATP-binding protein [Candidatus Kryptobacter bacterium]|nr:ATP-binding protein [Candidatus Kryptobacter bacterium]